MLEIGSDVEGRMLLHLASLGVERVVGVNPDEEIWRDRGTDEIELGPRVSLRNADARSLPFDAATFDAVFSVAALEHVHEIPAGARRDAPRAAAGGILYAAFGPIWSGRRGHHLRARVGEFEARHFRPETNPLPDFSHLLLTRDEMRAALDGRCAPQLTEPIVAWAFDDPGINRLFHHDYLKIFRASAFELVALGAEADPVDPQLRALLEFRYPKERRFDVTNAEVVLRKTRA